MFLLVEGVSEFGDDEEILMLDNALFIGALDVFTTILLVAVVEGAVKEHVAGLNGTVDGRGGVLSDLPASKVVGNYVSS